MGIKNGLFVEHAKFGDNYYGTSVQAIDDVAKKNLICILEIDVVGAEIIKSDKKINANYTFITTNGGLDTLKKRLDGRNTETQEQINKRLKTAEKELAFLESKPNFFGCVISNDDLEDSVQRMILQFRKWYPWIVIDNIADESSVNGNSDDEKLMSSKLILEYQPLDALFNALQFDGATVYDLRSKEEYVKMHAIGSINVQNVDDVTAISQRDNLRIFVYGGDEVKNMKMFGIAKKLNAVQFCVINGKFEDFEKKYPFLCIDDNEKIAKDRTRYPNIVRGTNDRIFVGGEAHAFDVNVIKDLGITHIVNTKGSEPKLDANTAKTLKYINIKIEDVEKQSVIPFFDDSCSFVQNALNENESNKVLIHCGGGKSRSTTFTMAYLIKCKQQSLAYAYGIVSLSRPKAYPNDGFLDDLEKYEIANNGKSTKQFVVNSELRNKNRWKKVLASWRI